MTKPDDKERAQNGSQEEGGREEEKRTSRFAPVFSQFRTSIDALREFFSRLTPLVSDIETGIVEERRQRLRDVVGSFGKRVDETQSGDLTRFAEWISDVVSPDAKESSFTFEGDVPADLVVEILKTASEPAPSPAHHELLNRSILMSLVAHFEVVVSDLAHAFYAIEPDATSNDDKVLSVNELKTFDSMDEAMQSVISQRVDDLLRGSIEDWRKFFSTRMNVDLNDIVPDWPQWCEMFQRRHVIVHAGGKVTRRYLEKVDWDKVKWPSPVPSPGSLLPVEDDYVVGALDLFEIAGLVLCEALAGKLAPQEGGRLEALLETVYRRLKSGDWYVAEHLSQWGEDDPDANEEESLMFRFNRWLTIKRQGRWPEIESEVKAFDCSAKHPQFSLALACLEEAADRFFEELPGALAAGLPPIALRDWPILEEMRSDKRFPAALAKAERGAKRSTSRRRRSKAKLTDLHVRKVRREQPES